MAARAEPGATPTEEFDYPLPPGAIAQRPLADRASSRMLVLAGDGVPEDRSVAELPRLLGRGDCLVLNDTRVRPARLRGRVGDRPAELLLLRELEPGRFSALVRPGRQLGPGATVLGPGWRASVRARLLGHSGERELVLEFEKGVTLEQVGEVPLPPYLRERLSDPERYQTVYARGPAVSAAAPTAGLHLTEPLLAQIRARGIQLCRVQLEVGIGTFAPIRSGTVEAHRMHSERCRIPGETAELLRASRAAGGRVVAVGTTVVRCLESRADHCGGVRAGEFETSLYLRPGSRFEVVDGLLTNFHQPRSSLLVMVSAFFGTEVVRDSYQRALERGYRFLSFGDCMFGWRSG